MSPIENLVAPGGPCHGAQVVFQEDNAGPHIEGTYRGWMQSEFTKRKWIIELQAPQGVYLETIYYFVTQINNVYPLPSFRSIYKCTRPLHLPYDAEAPFRNTSNLQ